MNRIVCSLLPLLTACADEAQEASTDFPEPTVQVWTSGAVGFHTNSFWLDTGAEVVVFDAQFTPELAEALIADIQASTDTPITTLVITHPNPDKFNGAPAFQAIGAQVIASQGTVDAMPGVHAYKKAYFEGVGMFPEGTYPALPTVDRVFDGELELGIEGLETSLWLVQLDNPGVTTTQTIAIAGDDVFVGDLVASQTHAWLEGGIVEGVATPDLQGWQAALDEVLQRVGPDATVHPGRGPSANAEEVLLAQRHYLDGARFETEIALSQHNDPVAALEKDGPEVYAAIAQRMATAYPDHAHDYLVTYGVYGLAWQVALSQ